MRTYRPIEGRPHGRPRHQRPWWWLPSRQSEAPRNAPARDMRWLLGAAGARISAPVERVAGAHERERYGRRPQVSGTVRTEAADVRGVTMPTPGTAPPGYAPRRYACTFGDSRAPMGRAREPSILNRRRLPCGECLPNVASDDVAVYARALRAGIDSSAARSKSARWLSSGQKTTNSVTPMSRKADTILSNASGVAQASSAS